MQLATIPRLHAPAPLYLLQRHPLTVTAHFAYSLVLTFALPRAELEPMLPPGLRLDTHGDFGFVAIAIVQTNNLRPALLPRVFGQDFFLAGYRIFTTFKPTAHSTLRGLYILRSDTDRRLMATAGNLLTHYRYRVSKVSARWSGRTLACSIATRNGLADLEVSANVEGAAELPAATPFASPQEARRFAGPLPYTFDHEPQTNSIIVIKGVRKNWNPRLVPATVHRATFFDHGVFAGTHPRLASAFFVQNIDYQWNPGVRHSLARAGGDCHA
jgi:hypothetical protein